MQNKHFSPSEFDSIAPIDDVNNSYKSLPTNNKDTLVVKGKFKFGTSGIYGIFSILLNINQHVKNQSNFSDFVLLASYFSDLYNTNLNESWVTLEEKFNKLQINGDFAASVTNIFYQAFKDRFSDTGSFAFAIVNDFKSNNIDKIHSLLEDVFLSVHKERNIIVELFFEELSNEDLHSTKRDRIKKETEMVNSNPPIKEIETPEGFNIPARPMLAPISDGIPSELLKPKMKILMKIDASSPTGQRWIETFKALDKKTGKIEPIIATVTQVSRGIKNSIDVLVHYNPNQYSKFTIESGVKIRLYNAEGLEMFIDPQSRFLEEQINKKPEVSWKNLFKDPSFIIMSTVGIVLLIISAMAFFFI